MATGRLGTANLTTTTATSVYTVPTTTFSVVSVSVCNRSASVTSTVRIAVSTSATAPVAAEWLEYDSTLVPNGVLERTGIVMDSTNKYLVVQTNTASSDLAVTVMGIETSTA